MIGWANLRRSAQAPARWAGIGDGKNASQGCDALTEAAGEKVDARGGLAEFHLLTLESSVNVSSN
jgi:hypothetical protein